MISNMDFKPITERLALEQGDGSQYAVHVSEIINEVITNFSRSLDKVGEENPNNEELLRIEATRLIKMWLKAMKEDVNKRNQSVFWAKNLLVLLVKTLDQVNEWHPYLCIVDNELKAMLPKHYSLNK